MLSISVTFREKQKSSCFLDVEELEWERSVLSDEWSVSSSKAHSDHLALVLISSARWTPVLLSTSDSWQSLIQPGRGLSEASVSNTELLQKVLSAGSEGDCYADVYVIQTRTKKKKNNNPVYTGLYRLEGSCRVHVNLTELFCCRLQSLFFIC